jgi:hypothetical protein
MILVRLAPQMRVVTRQPIPEINKYTPSFPDVDSGSNKSGCDACANLGDRRIISTDFSDADLRAADEYIFVTLVGRLESPA